MWSLACSKDDCSRFGLSGGFVEALHVQRCVGKWSERHISVVWEPGNGHGRRERCEGASRKSRGGG